MLWLNIERIRSFWIMSRKNRSIDREGSGWLSGEVSSPEGGRALEQAPQESGNSTKPAGGQEAFGKRSSDICLNF